MDPCTPIVLPFRSRRFGRLPLSGGLVRCQVDTLLPVARQLGKTPVGTDGKGIDGNGIRAREKLITSSRFVGDRSCRP